MKTLPRLLLLVLAIGGCDTPSRKHEQDAEVEAPVWAFGWGSMQHDSVPAAIFTDGDWSDYDIESGAVVYKVDLNGDGSDEWMIRSDSTLCGQFGGCPTRIVNRSGDGTYRIVYDDLAKLVYVTNRRVDGWPVLWTTYGGLNGHIARVAFRDSTYHDVTIMRRNSEMSEWNAEDYARDTLWQKLEAAILR